MNPTPGLKPEFAEWDLQQKYEPIKLIGSGSYGSVIRARCINTKEEVAIKRISKVFAKISDGKRILREIALLKRLRHPNIISLREILIPKNDLANFEELFIVLELAPADLKQIVHSKTTFFSIADITLISYNILLGLKYIHSAGVWHRDLKPANVLVFPKGQAKICDFGLARPVEEFHSLKEVKQNELVVELPSVRPKIKKSKLKNQLTTHVVTRWYRAPELILMQKNYSGKIDVWALGCIFAELLYMIKDHTEGGTERKPLFPGDSCFPLSPHSSQKVRDEGEDQLLTIIKILGTPSDDQMNFITDEKVLSHLKSFPEKKKMDFGEIFPKASPQALSFLEGCLRFSPEQRLSVDECLAHPFFEKIRTPQVEIEEKEKIVLEFESDDIKTKEELRKYFVKELART